ncbi:MAG TPA: hypothetical protein VIR27_22085 [Mycobacteriales bacterium]
MVEVPSVVHEAMRRAGVVWLRAADTSGSGPAPAWVLWQDGAAYLVTGPGEQPAPGLVDTDHADSAQIASLAEVTVASTRTASRIVVWQAAVSRVEPGGEQWRAVVPALVSRRLNLADQDAAQARWADRCVVLRLEPTGEFREA